MTASTDPRRLIDLRSVGPATVKDLALLGITSVDDLARYEAVDLFARLNQITGQRHDPCCQDVFACAIAQARDPDLADEQKEWPYWSRQRKSALGPKGRPHR